MTVGDDGTLFSQVTSAESFITTTTTTGTISRVWNIPLTAEFDIIDVNGTPQFQIYDGTNYNNWHMSIGHWVFNRDSDGNCTMTKDGVAVNPTSTAQTITDVFRIGFQTRSNTNYNLKFRNFTVYSTGATGGGATVMYYDPCTSDTTSRYYINTSVGNSLTSTADAMRFQLGTTDKFVQLDTNKTSVISVSDFVGKDVIFAVTLNNTTNSTLVAWCFSNGQGSD